MQQRSELFLRSIRSFVCRDGRMTAAQTRAVKLLLPRYQLPLNAGVADFAQAFGRQAPVVLEIGFGTGHSLLEAAVAYPEMNFLGIETHLPGLGSLLSGVEAKQPENIRVCHGDAVAILEKVVPDRSLAGIQLFFPDPWPKRKHHKRRLIQPPFVQLLCKKLVTNGWIHLATDWEDYALQMMRVLSAVPELVNQAGAGQYAARAKHRPVVTRFEQRGTAAGRLIRELDFVLRLD